MTEEIKVGDCVVSVGCERWDVTRGREYQIISIDEGYLYPYNFIDDVGDENSFREGDFELCKPAVNELEVGKEYKCVNGHTYTAMFENSEGVWMQGRPDSPMYMWNKDGTPVSLVGVSGYGVDWGPVIKEGVHLDYSKLEYKGFEIENTQRLTVTTVDGVPDWTTLKVVES